MSDGAETTGPRKLRRALISRKLFEETFVLVTIFTPEGRLIEANHAAFKALGARPEEVLGRPYTKIQALAHSQDVLDKVTASLASAAQGHATRTELTVLLRGRLADLDCLVIPLCDVSGKIVQIAATSVEITAQRRAEASLVRVNRELRMLSSCNQALLHAQREEGLLADICRTIVESGGYLFSWVGVPQNDAAKSVQPVAQSGLHTGYLDTARISWADTERGQGPIGRAIREQVMRVCHDIDHEPSFAPWREDALRRGYVSAIALPLMSEAHCLGVLTIYSGRMNAFDTQEAALLEELAGDLAYGISALRARAAHKHQEARIARLMRILRMQNSINAAVLRLRDRDELLHEVCRLAVDVGGYERAVLFVVDEEGRKALPRFGAGPGLDVPKPPAISIGDGTEPDSSLAERALRTGEVIICGDLTQPEPPIARREKLVELGYRSLAALPLIVDGRRLGVLTLGSRDPNLVQDEELVLLQEIAVSLSLVMRSQQQADAARFLAYFDPLTGLAKRALFCERLDDELRHLPGLLENPTVVVFDVQRLGHINDTLGRHIGDLVLQEISERLKRSLGGDEWVGYLGGGAFAFLVARFGAADQGGTALLEGDIFGEPFSIKEHSVRLSYRSGAAHFPADGSDGDTLLQRAEAALKEAKSSGEQYLHYRLEMRGEVAERLRLEQKLRTAVDEQHFDVYYQPLVNLTSGRIESVEALLRWNDPEEGLVLPARFLPTLEDMGLLARVGDWVLRRVVEDCERWSRQALSPVRVAVNISAVQLRRKGFVADLLELREGLRAAEGFGLDLEITETTLLRDLEGASQRLRELRGAGFRIALDDFGTGYSSLGLLSQLPVDLLKIDRSFIKGLPDDVASRVLAESIIRLASAFQLITVAEGVETEGQLEAVRELGCSLSQGYLHHAPMPRRELEKVMAEGSRSRTYQEAAGVPSRV